MAVASGHATELVHAGSDPAAIDARFRLGAALHAADRPEEALAIYQQLVREQPGNALFRNDLGVVLQSLSRVAEAIEQFRQAISLKPDLGEAYCNVGNALMELGLIDAAHAACLTAVATNPKRGVFYFNLANVRRFSEGDQYLAAMERLVEANGTRDSDDLIALRFALGKAYDDIGQPDAAMQLFLAANALKRRSVAYDEAATLGEMERIRASFDRAALGGTGGGEPSDLPVFIVGMPRSGTTLVEQIVSSHPQVHGAGELYALHRIVAALDAFPEATAALADGAFAEIGRRYLDRLEFKRPGALRVTDKMPWNFRYIGLIRRALPNARIIHVSRDPVATCLSCFSRLFNKNQEFSYDLAELGRYYRGYRALMDHWRAVLPEGAMLEVRYEDVVADLEGQARRLIAYCGLDWNAACLAFQRNGRVVRTASATQVRKPLYTSSLDRWRAHSTFAAPLLDALGPDLAGASK